MIVGDFSHSIFEHGKPIIDIDNGIMSMTVEHDQVIFSGTSDLDFDYYCESNGNLEKIHCVKGNINYNLKSVQSQKLEYYQAKKQLGQDFGTRKTKTMLKNMEKSAVQQGTLDALEKAMGVTDTIMEDIQPAAESDFKSLLVPFNATTTNVEAIYPLENVMSIDILNTLDIKRILDVFHDIAKLKKETATLSLYSQQRLIRLSKANQSDVNSIRWYLVIDMLIKLYKTSARNNMSLVNLKKSLICSDEMAEFLMSTFTEFTSDEHSKFKHLLTVPMKQKIMNYLLVLVLHMEHFNCILLNSPSVLNNEGVDMEISALLKDLHFSLPKFVERFQWIGCKVEALGKAGATSVMQDRMICPFKDNKWPPLRYIELIAPLVLKQ